MISQKFYAIKHILSDAFLPSPYKHTIKKTTFTWLEPDNTQTPRLYLTRRSAMNSLRQYVRGNLVVGNSKALQNKSLSGAKLGEVVAIGNQHRKVSDYVIVEVLIREE